ncbi:MAG: hypothetical protein VB083_01300 [Aminobacterium sp.]|uniref:hypothetical protein n=1 Tax=Aminobacterium sp. TaxID=1872491 RepID=UPI002B1F4244|nr:hypothetical protein [Aminobacterium sp.]MEA4876527.1 hypothetical protein [Aminobacterium sp.]
MKIKWRISNNFTGVCAGRKDYAKAAAHLKYITRAKECLEFEHISRNFENLKILSDRYEISRKWTEISCVETGISKEKDFEKMRTRKDAKIAEKFNVPLPNDIFENCDDEERKNVCRKIAYAVAGDSADFSYALHQGKKEGQTQNLHLHIIFRTRKKNGKKPDFSKLEKIEEMEKMREKIAEVLREQGYDATTEKRKDRPDTKKINGQKWEMWRKGKLRNPRDVRACKYLEARRKYSNENQKIAYLAARQFFGEEEGKLPEKWGIVERVAKNSRKKRKTLTIVDLQTGKSYALRRLLGVSEMEIREKIQKKIQKMKETEIEMRENEAEKAMEEREKRYERGKYRQIKGPGVCVRAYANGEIDIMSASEVFVRKIYIHTDTPISDDELKILAEKAIKNLKREKWEEKIKINGREITIGTEKERKKEKKPEKEKYIPEMQIPL